MNDCIEAFHQFNQVCVVCLLVPFFVGPLCLVEPFSLGAEAVQVFNDIFIPGLTASLSLPVLFCFGKSQVEYGFSRTAVEPSVCCPLQVSILLN